MQLQIRPSGGTRALKAQAWNFQTFYHMLLGTAIDTLDKIINMNKKR